jgi:hypothetical protein
MKSEYITVIVHRSFLKTFLILYLSFKIKKHLLDGKHADVGLNTPIKHNGEDARGRDVGLRWKMIPGRKSGPDSGDHIFQETSCLKTESQLSKPTKYRR